MDLPVGPNPQRSLKEPVPCSLKLLPLFGSQILPLWLHNSIKKHISKP